MSSANGIDYRKLMSDMNVPAAKQAAIINLMAEGKMSFGDATAAATAAEAAATAAPKANGKANGKAESLEAEVARLRAENAALSQKAAAKRAFGMKVSAKGCLSVYGAGRFPVSLYREQWEWLAGHMPAILAEAAKLPKKAAQ